MRILLVGMRNWQGAWTESTLFALKDMGHTVQVFYYQDMAPSPQNRTLNKMRRMASQINIRLPNGSGLMKKRLIKESHDFEPDLILVLKGEVFDQKTLETLKRKNTLLATWWVDDPFSFPEAVRAYPVYDAFFVFEQDYVAHLEQLGIPHVTHLPNAHAANIFYPLHLTERDQSLYQCDVAFVGSYYPPREEMFKQLRGKNIAIWGPGWNRSPRVRDYLDIRRAWRGQFLPVREAAKLYNMATICLNHHHQQITFNGLNLRAFEILACGGFELIDHRDGFEAFFATNQEIVYYHSFDEIGALVEHYLSHPGERKEIAQHGYERVVKEHSYHHRMEKVLSWAVAQQAARKH